MQGTPGLMLEKEKKQPLQSFMFSMFCFFVFSDSSEVFPFNTSPGEGERWREM